MRIDLKGSRLVRALIAAQTLACAAWAEAGTGGHMLDGTRVEWRYNNSEATMRVSFAEGLGQYEWIAGRRAGNSDTDIPYSAREISPNIFLMSWVQADRPDFITMIFDFNAMTIATTGLIGFDQADYRFLFMDGVINTVER